MTETTLPPWTAASLAMLLDALDGMALSVSERASLAWLAEFGTHTVKNIQGTVAFATVRVGVCPAR
jgi:hypothetical protein